MPFPNDYDDCTDIDPITVIDYTPITQAIVASQTSIEAKIDTLDSGLRQILLNLGDEIDENEVAIENASKSMTMII